MQQAARFNLHDARRLPAPLQSPAGTPVLYTHVLCPYAQRVLMALLHKAVPFELVHVDLSAKPGWFRRVHPQALVPALVHNGETHIESLDICSWMEQEQAFASCVPLTPAEPRLQRHMQQLLASTPSIVSAGLEMAAGSTERLWGVGTSPSAAQRGRFEQACAQLAVALQDTGGPFLAGPQLSLADVALFPFLDRVALALAAVQGYDLAALQQGNAVAHWLAAVRATDAGTLSAPDKQLFQACVLHHRSLDWFDFVSVDIGAAHPHLLVSSSAGHRRRHGR